MNPFSAPGRRLAHVASRLQERTDMQKNSDSTGYAWPRSDGTKDPVGHHLLLSGRTLFFH